MSNRVDSESYQRAQEVLRANIPPRYSRLDQLGRYVEGTQYEGLANWWREDLPLLERAPCIQYPIVARAISSNRDMVLGEGRFPAFTTGTEEDDTDTVFDKRFGLTKEQSKKLDKFIKTLVNTCSVRSLSQQALAEAQGCSSVCALVVVRSGAICIDLLEAKTAVPTYNTADPQALESVEVKYPYLDEFYNELHKRWEARVLVYRRVIDAHSDTTYHPVVAHEHGVDIDASAWRPREVIAHNLGFCPAIWYRFRPKASARGVDGIAIHSQVLDEIDGLNRAISMRHRAALFSGDPQIVETGVEPDEQPGPMGRPQRHRAYQPGDLQSMKEWGNVGGAAAMQTISRKKGSGVIWRYHNPQTKVAFLTLPADALAVINGDVKEILDMLKESMAVVFVEPGENTNVSGEISGRALEWLHKKQIESCDTIRSDFGDGFLLPLVGMLLRVVHVVANRATGALFLPGLAKALPILKKFEAEIALPEGATARWFKPYIRLLWPPYFRLTSADAKMDIDGTIAAKNGGLITLETAVRKNQAHFGIDDVSAYLETLREEKQKAVEDARRAFSTQKPGAVAGDEEPGMQNKSTAESFESPSG